MIEGIGDVIRTEERAFANVGEAGLDFWFVSSSLLKVQVLKRSPLGQRDGDIMRTSFSNSKLCEAPITRTGKGQKSTLQESRCSCKHCTAYDLENWEGVTMYAFNANVSMQDMFEYYLPPFQQCARDSRLEFIMYLYNAVNGVPTCAGEYLLQKVPRDHWNWTDQNQCVVSDCNAVHSIMGSHHYTNNLSAATVLGVHRGDR